MADTKKVRILHVVGAMNRGGTETMLMNIYRKINHEYVQFDFISYSQDEAHYDQEIEQLGGRVIRLTNTSSIIEIYQAIQMHGPFVAVHAHTLFHCGLSMLAAQWAGIPVRIAHAHTTSDDDQNIMKKSYIKLMRMIIRKYATDFLACSKEAGTYLFGNNYLKNPNDRYFPNVIDYESFLSVPQTKVNEFKIESGLGSHLVLGHIGTFKTVKNHTFLLDIMKELQEEPDIKMVLVGDGELKEEMQERARSLGIDSKICFVGLREDIQTVLHSIDVFVFPSMAEGLGLVLLEAQASGIPCLVSEAIQPEADVGLGLVTSLSLATGPEAWAYKATEIAIQKEQDSSKIIDHFKRSGYNIKTGISMLMGIYRVCRGDKYEESTDYIL